MGYPIDLSGMRFGRWTVLRECGRSKSGGVLWLCKCDCGTERCVNGGSLRNGVSNSCGCLGAEHRIEASRIAKTKHGGKKERLYSVWRSMLDRCYNQSSTHFCDYGGRGITVCDEWHDYATFREWSVTNGYDKEAKHGACTIDRIDNNAGYYPDNCRWVNSEAQCNNRRNNHIIEFNGVTHTISEWSRITGIRKDTLRRRIVMYGWSIERALTEPNKHKQHSS